MLPLSLCGLQPLELPRCNLKPPLFRGERETSERVTALQIGSGRFNKQGNLLSRLVLNVCKMSTSPYLPTKS